MAGESSAEARAKADAYASKKAQQVRLQTLNAKVNTPIVKVNTKKQASGSAIKRTDANGRSGFGITSSTGTTASDGPDSSLKGAYDYDPNSALNKSWNTPNGGIQNPKFIYPGYTNRDAVNNKTVTVERGYIRRLTEFYDKENKQAKESGKSTASTIRNMKCNFQFNPDNITRMVTAESDMQFFFNQDPSQLAQPIPGKAGFAFELLFNREAEVASQRYFSGDKIVRANFKENISNTLDFLDPSKPYDPSWVTRIGVLADILILDDVIGQGLAKDIYNAIQSEQTADAAGNTWGFSKDSPSSPTNPTGEDTKKIDQTRYDAYSMNIGNKAFLTPTPVRILFTKWMMVEGFVQSIQVTFNKFSSDMIPTQATVMIQMQALYMGFAQQNTFLTQLPDIDVGDNNAPVQTTPSPNTPEFDRYKEYDDLLKKKDFFNRIYSINHVPRKGKTTFSPGPENTGPEQPALLFKHLFEQTDESSVMFWISEETRIGKNGEDWINQWKSEGKNFSFYWDGVLKVYWDSHVVNTNGTAKSRQTFVANAPGSYIYKPGAPPKQSSTDFAQWGTEKDPWVFKVEGQLATADTGRFGQDLMHTNKGGQTTDRWFTTKGEGTDWTFDTTNRPDITSGTLLKPFEQDKFTVELGIRWRIEDDVMPGTTIFLYDWHYKKQTFEVHNAFMDNNEWFYAWNNGSYRDITGAGANISGEGVRFFKSVGM